MDSYAAVIFLLSTTGDGSPPDDALPFIKSLTKYLDQVGGQLPSLRYALLGLGDTNYSKFCRPAKQLDALLLKAGAQRFFATGLADDGVGCGPNAIVLPLACHGPDSKTCYFCAPC